MIIMHEPGESIFDSGADLLVNPVNCEGVSGKGLALEFKKRFPDGDIQYRLWCEYRCMQPGMAPIWMKTRRFGIAYFSTKDSWRSKSRLSWIADGLDSLRGGVFVRAADSPMSLAIPALGCGLGQLRWDDVLPLIKSRFDNYDGTVHIYPPHEAARGDTQ